MENINNDKQTEIAMFYNLENLYTPGFMIQQRSGDLVPGLLRWNEKRYRNKLFKMASVFQLVREQEGVLPFITGICEVQGAEPIEELLKLEPFNEEFGYVHFESLDERGVDVALLYDKSKVEIISAEPISFFFEIQDVEPESFDTTRDILFCKIRYKTELINVFVFHLPSKRENDVNKPKRKYILKEINTRVQKIISENNEPVILLGDFNENPDDELLEGFLLDSNYQTVLENPFINLFRKQHFSTFHYRNGLLFDQILLSEHFNTEKSVLEFSEAKVFAHQKILNWDKKFRGRPFRTYAGTRYLGGYSDHFPVLVKFETYK